MKQKTRTFLVGRSAIDGTFMTVAQARQEKDTAIVQKITVPIRSKKRK